MAAKLLPKQKRAPTRRLFQFDAQILCSFLDHALKHRDYYEKQHGLIQGICVTPDIMMGLFVQWLAESQQLPCRIPSRMSMGRVLLQVFSFQVNTTSVLTPPGQPPPQKTQSKKAYVFDYRILETFLGQTTIYTTIL